MVSIRRATLSDSPQLAILVSLFSGSPTTSEQIKNRLISMQTTEQVIVAVDPKSDILTGFGSLRLVPNFSDDSLYAELTDLFVHPDFRRLKIAHQITSFIEKICLDKKISQLVLITGFDNQGAQSFYKRIGFSDWALAMKKKLY
jgi:ribosomal protein S18 acetylase RimI-like enzyme